MGKKQHSKDRMYLTATEWKNEWGGHKSKQQVKFSRLPFHCCAITFTPFEDPVCTEDGMVFDIVNIVPYVQKHKRHPVTGAPLKLQDLIKLKFYRNADGEFHCPVLNKVFTEHTHIVAVKPTGNVYSYEAVEQLNIKPKNWKDLLTDEPFTRKDIIQIQDPRNIANRAIDAFDHVKRDLRIDNEDAAGESGGADSIRNVTDDMQRALGALKTGEAAEAFAKGGGGKRAEAARIFAEAKSKAAANKAAADGGSAGGAATAAASDAAGAGAAPGEDWRLRAPKANQDMPKFKAGASTWDTDDYSVGAAAKQGKKRQGGGTAAAAAAGDGPSTSGRPSPAEWYESRVRYVQSMHTTGAASRAFTSTVAAPTTVNARQMERQHRNPSKKGYCRLHTSLGDLNIELHCDIAPRTCENFLALCEMGYYDGVTFHRSIKNFMIQGGDPTGTGTGGESIYGKTFRDELDSRLLHSGRGVLSMANSGKDTNGSQFFILYKSAAHLNYKHSVFGRVVGGFDALTAMERVPTDEEDRPKQEIKILSTEVFTNPYKEMEEEEQKQEARELKKKQQENDEDPENKVGSWFTNPSNSAPKDGASVGVGKYLSDALVKASPAAAEASEGSGLVAPPSKKAKTIQAASFGNFDAW